MVYIETTKENDKTVTRKVELSLEHYNMLSESERSNLKAETKKVEVPADVATKVAEAETKKVEKI